MPSHLFTKLSNSYKITLKSIGYHSPRQETGAEILLPCAESKQSLFDKYAEMCKSADSAGSKN